MAISTTIFESYKYGSVPTSFLEQREGEVTFGELKKGDVIYFHELREPYGDSIEIKEIKVKSKVKTNKVNQSYIPIEPIPRYKNQPKRMWDTQLIIGPNNVSGGDFVFDGKRRHYEWEEIMTSSVCIRPSGNLVIFGTNKETVKELARLGIEDKIQNINMEIRQLQITANALTKLK